MRIFERHLSNTDIVYVPVYFDNYVYMLIQGKRAGAVDPGAAGPVIAYLKKHDLKLSQIFCTHHHHDHVGGVEELKKTFGCVVYGPPDTRIPSLDKPLSDKERIYFEDLALRVMSVTGHTRSHIAYYAPEGEFLFTGDCLFLGGCGRVFEGTPEQMYNSLKKLAGLPDSTWIFPGHEYTQENLEFALSLEPNHKAVSQRLARVRKIRRTYTPTVPGTISEERTTNPFLRVHENGLRKVLHMEDASNAEVFGAIRRLKDKF